MLLGQSYEKWNGLWICRSLIVWSFGPLVVDSRFSGVDCLSPVCQSVGSFDSSQGVSGQGV